MAFGNGVSTNYTYSSSGNLNCTQDNFRPCTITTGNAVSTYQDLRYGYDNAGNVQSIVDPINDNQSFGYDELNRLTVKPYRVIKPYRVRSIYLTSWPDSATVGPWLALFGNGSALDSCF